MTPTDKILLGALILLVIGNVLLIRLLWICGSHDD